MARVYSAKWSGLIIMMIVMVWGRGQTSFAQIKDGSLKMSDIPMTWKDFTPVNSNDSTFSARTYIQLDMSWNSKGIQGGNTLQVVIKCTTQINKKGTVVKKSILELKDTSQQNQLLDHEKGHWLIALINLKKLADGFASIDLNKNYKSEIDSFFKKGYQDYQAEQNQYDAETNHGLIKTIQLEWEEKLLEEASADYDKIEIKPVILTVNKTVFLK